MNLEEYRKRLDRSYIIAGANSQSEELQKVRAERDRYQYIAKMFYDNRFIHDPDQTRYAAKAYEEMISHEASDE